MKSIETAIWSTVPELAGLKYYDVSNDSNRRLCKSHYWFVTLREIEIELKISNEIIEDIGCNPNRSFENHFQNHELGQKVEEAIAEPHKIVRVKSSSIDLEQNKTRRRPEKG